MTTADVNAEDPNVDPDLLPEPDETEDVDAVDDADLGLPDWREVQDDGADII